MRVKIILLFLLTGLKLNSAQNLEPVDLSEHPWVKLKTEIVSNNLENFKILLNNNLNLLNAQDKLGMTLLMYCCSFARAKFVQFLLTKNPDISLTNDFDGSPTALALARDNSVNSSQSKKEIIEMLENYQNTKQ